MSDIAIIIDCENEEIAELLLTLDKANVELALQLSIGLDNVQLIQTCKFIEYLINVHYECYQNANKKLYDKLDKTLRLLYINVDTEYVISKAYDILTNNEKLEVYFGIEEVWYNDWDNTYNLESHGNIYDYPRFRSEYHLSIS